jgi:hypothetical protein
MPPETLMVSWFLFSSTGQQCFHFCCSQLPLKRVDIAIPVSGHCIFE